MTTTIPSLAIPPAPVDTSAASTYSDLNGLASLKADPTSPQSINAVAGQVEALFLQMMLKSMRDATATESSDSNEMDMYHDMFDKQIALSLSQHDDLGIGRMLKRQLGGQAAVPSKAAASSHGAEPLARTPAEFVHRVLPTISRAARALGVDPKGLLAQAALETGWGRRMPRTAEGALSLNIFGVKAGDEWSGARATSDSVEFSNGVATPRRSTFRAYGSIEESVADFAKLLKNSPRYRDAIAAGADPAAYAHTLGKSGYATDPEYGNKLNQILKSDTLQAALGVRTAAL